MRFRVASVGLVRLLRLLQLGARGPARLEDPLVQASGQEAEVALLLGVRLGDAEVQVGAAGVVGGRHPQQSQVLVEHHLVELVDLAPAASR